MAASKTNRTGKEIQVQKTHYCPECGEESKLVKRLPRGAMWGRCTSNHSFRKKDLVLK